MLALALAPVGSAAGPRLGGAHACPDAPGFTCSTLVVPLDHSGAVAGTLRLQVAAATNTPRRAASCSSSRAGRASPACRSSTRLAERLGSVTDGYRLVVVDQRGTGAGALDCPALQRAMGSSDLKPPPAAAVRSCGAAIGPKRRFFGTDDVVADLDLLRRALGAERWSLDGVSYGTFVAERYALAHPQRVSRLVLDSVVPHTGADAMSTTAMRATARVLGDVCGSACVADLAAVIRARHDGPDLLDRLTLLSIVDPTFEQQFDVPRLLHAAARGDTDALDRFVAETANWGAGHGGAAQPGPARERALRGLPLPVGRLRLPAREPRRAARARRRPPAPGRPRPVRPRHGDRQRHRPPVPPVARDHAHARAAAQREAPAGADAPARRHARPLDAARVGPPRARPRPARPPRRRPGRRPQRPGARAERRGPPRGRAVPRRPTLKGGVYRASGSRSVKRPPASSGCAVISPPALRASRCASERPRPAPPRGCGAGRACPGSKIVSRSSAATPGPSSSTSTDAASRRERG